ncbi:hypothetical protein L9F63_023800, partial [Diploptera punctata]
MMNVTDAVMEIYYPRSATIFAAVCAVLFSVVGVVGNLITAIALLRCSKLRHHATTAFVISLCMSDLLFCTINLPLTASRYINEAWVLSDTLCQLFPFFFYGNVAASLLSMVAITINRYILISCHNLYDKLYKPWYIGLMLAFAWIFSFSMMVLPLIEVWGRLVIIVSYTCIYWKVRQSRKNLEAHKASAKVVSPASKTSQFVQKRDDVRLTRLMLTIFCCFLLCFLPLMLMNVVDDEIRYPTIHVLASVLAWASSVINPFIYAGSNRQYRGAFRRLLCCSSVGQGDVSRRTGKTFITDTLQYNVATEKVKVMDRRMIYNTAIKNREQ